MPSLPSEISSRARARAGDPAIVETDHGQDAAGLRLAGGRGHGFGLGQGVGQRLLHEDVFARGERGDGDLGVHKAGGADVDDVDVVAGDDRPPVRGGFRPAVPGCGVGNPGSVPPDDDPLFEGRDVEVAGHIAPGVRVGLA